MYRDREDRLDGREGFAQGVRDGIPIGLGYFAVSFTLGITARDCGFSVLEGFVASLLTYASAGEYIGFTLFAANATLIQLILMTVITNARYVLMGFALNQRIEDGTSKGRRILAGLTITDEIFGISIARTGYIDPRYPLGAMAFAIPMWAAGTAFGISMGNILPDRIVSALSVALFGMFLAAIIPACKRNRTVTAVVIVSFASSYAADTLSIFQNISAGNKIIILMLGISSLAAILAPVDPGAPGEPEEVRDEK